MKLERTNEELERQISFLENELQIKSDELQKSKHAFLSYVSHEVRTPMHAVMGFSELLSNNQLGPGEREEYTLYIQECCRNLLNVVDNMIDAALLDNNELKLAQQECDLNQIMDELYSHFRVLKHRMEKYSVAVLMNTQFKNQGFQIVTDAPRLKQILSGLIDNALKFTSRGIVEFGYHINEDQFIQFYVSDSGQGGLAKAGQLLLENFNRISLNGSCSHNELSPGLRMAKGVIEALGGNIWVENNTFNGSTFFLTVPFIPTKMNQVHIAFEPAFKRVI
jgi:signal transduction histidine kinase